MASVINSKFVSRQRQFTQFDNAKELNRMAFGHSSGSDTHSWSLLIRPSSICARKEVTLRKFTLRYVRPKIVHRIFIFDWVRCAFRMSCEPSSRRSDRASTRVAERLELGSIHVIGPWERHGATRRGNGALERE